MSKPTNFNNPSVELAQSVLVGTAPPPNPDCPSSTLLNVKYLIRGDDLETPTFGERNLALSVVLDASLP